MDKIILSKLKLVHNRYMAENGHHFQLIDDEGPYATLTVCLKDYGITPEDDTQVIFKGEYLDDQIKALLFDVNSPIGIFDSVIGKFNYGYNNQVEALLVTLRKGWQDYPGLVVMR